jgi:hypothetical protein
MRYKVHMLDILLGMILFSFSSLTYMSRHPSAAEQLKLNENPDRAHLQVVVIDSHRPFSLSNVYGDNTEENVGDIEKARVLLVHDPDLEADEIPDKDTVHLYGEDCMNQEEEEEEDFDEYEGPVQRRRVNEDGESVAVAGGQEDDRDERRQMRQKRVEARAVVEEYYSGTSRGPPTAILLMDLSNGRVNNLDAATLWWAILGVTEQHINDDLDENLHDKLVENLMDSAISLNAKISTGPYLYLFESFYSTLYACPFSSFSGAWLLFRADVLVCCNSCTPV